MINRYISQFKMDKLLRKGVEHFNERLFYEAHEFWEEIWHALNGSEKAFFQGLILLAGAESIIKNNAMSQQKDY